MTDNPAPRPGRPGARWRDGRQPPAVDRLPAHLPVQDRHALAVSSWPWSGLHRPCHKRRRPHRAHHAASHSTPAHARILQQQTPWRLSCHWSCSGRQRFATLPDQGVGPVRPPTDPARSRRNSGATESSAGSPAQISPRVSHEPFCFAVWRGSAGRSPGVLTRTRSGTGRSEGAEKHRGRECAPSIDGHF